VNILVVEDEPELASALVRGLEEEQFSVQVCGEGKAALQKSEGGNFDLVLLDVMLPDLNGFDLVEQLRLRNRETLVLMLTARDSLADVVRGLDAGAGDVVLDIAAQRAFRGGVPLYLSLTEFRLLEVLARNRGQVVPRQAIIADVWGNRREVEDNTLDAYVRLLRKKIERDSQSKLIQTHRGLGYSMGLPSLS
jgi:DNA-binding response OmpR family regulator